MNIFKKLFSHKKNKNLIQNFTIPECTIEKIDDIVIKPEYNSFRVIEQNSNGEYFTIDSNASKELCRVSYDLSYADYDSRVCIKTLFNNNYHEYFKFKSNLGIEYHDIFYITSRTPSKKIERLFRTINNNFFKQVIFYSLNNDVHVYYYILSQKKAQEMLAKIKEQNYVLESDVFSLDYALEPGNYSIEDIDNIKKHIVHFDKYCYSNKKYEVFDETKDGTNLLISIL